MSPWYLLFWLKQVILLFRLSPELVSGENANIQRCLGLSLFTDPQHPDLPTCFPCSRSCLVSKLLLGSSSLHVNLLSGKRMH